MCGIPIVITQKIVYNKFTERERKIPNTRKGIKMSINELTKKVRELKELKAMADELAGEITAIEDDLKAEMIAQGVEEMQIDIFKLRYKTVVSSRFDSKAFKATHEELYKQYSKLIESRRFTVA